jgi:carbamoyltransferase
MVNKKFERLFGAPTRQPESKLTIKEINIARSIQVVTEDIILKLASTIKNEIKINNICLAGGVALNCVANGKILKTGNFKNIWIQPAAGDAGGALGAAYSIWHEYLNKPRILNDRDRMQGSYLGPRFSNMDC